MRRVEHIIESSELFEEKYEEYDFLVSMKEAEYGNELVRPIGNDGSLKYFDADFSNYKRQMYKDFTPNGAIFIGKPEAYLKTGHFFGARSISYIMSRVDSIDIDDEFDYELACFCMKKRISEVKK